MDPSACPQLPKSLAEELGLSLSVLKELSYELSPHGYGRAVYQRTAKREVVAIHWPAGSRSPLHSHSGAAAQLELLAGSIVESRFIPLNDGDGVGFRFVRTTLRPQIAAALPPDGIHAVEAEEESWGLHAYEPLLEEPTAAIPNHQLRSLEAAWRRDTNSRRAAELPWFLQDHGYVREYDPRTAMTG